MGVISPRLIYPMGPGWLVGKSAGLVMERLRVRIPAGVAEFSPPELTLCADLFHCPFHPRVTTMVRKRPWIFCQKCWWQVTPKHAFYP